MKLNMGCGHNKKEGYVNVDRSPECAPDIVCDLESLPWPWEDDTVDYVLFDHSLEHIGESSRVFLQIMQELYRVCRDGSVIEINVPHPRHDHFIGDPTHVRAITPPLLSLFDRKLNDEWKRIGASNTPFAHYLGVDFVIEGSKAILDEPYATLFAEKKLTAADLETLMREKNNIATEYKIKLRARKSY